MGEDSPLEQFVKYWRERGSNDFERIGPTAWMVARRRAFTDIPYSQEIFAALEEYRVERGIPDIPEELKTPELTPQFEARYKLVNRLLREYKTQQLLELASGLAPRGLEFSEDPDVTVVEVDLPEVMTQKQEIASTILAAKSGLPRPNLHLEAGNALNHDDLVRAAKHLDPNKPLSVTNEGLLRYLDFDEKAAVAKNVHELLERFGGGIWVTPDITLRKVMERENDIAKKQNERVKKITGIDIDQNRFDNVDQARTFFENLGFTIERHNFMEVVDELVSPQRLGIQRSEVEATISPAWVFVLRLNDR